MRTEHTTLVAQLIFIKSEKRDSATRTTRSGHGPKVAQRLTLIDMLIANRCDCDCDDDDDCNDDDDDDDCNSHLGTEQGRRHSSIHFQFDRPDRQVTTHNSAHVCACPGIYPWHVRFSFSSLLYALCETRFFLVSCLSAVFWNL